MVVKTKALVLHVVKFGDNQLIVDFLTEALGRLAFMIRMPKSSKSRLKRQYFQPMSVLTLEFDYRANARLQRLKDAAIALPFIDIPVSPYKMSMVMFLSEFLYHTTRNEQQNVPLFNFVVSSLQWLDLAQTGFANFHIVFMIRLTLFLGIAPNVEDAELGEYFDLMEGRHVRFVPAHSWFLNQQDSFRMRDLLRLRYQTMHLYTMSRQERNQCVEVIMKYYRLHMPDFPEMKTLPILQELFV